MLPSAHYLKPQASSLQPAGHVNGHNSIAHVPRDFRKCYAEADFHHRPVIVPPNISSFNEKMRERPRAAIKIAQQ